MLRSRGRKPPKGPKTPPLRQPEEQQAVTPPWWKKHWKALLAAAGGIPATVGFVSAMVTFLPRMIVEAAGQTDPSSPYPIPFTVTNTGVIPLGHVQPTIGVCSVTLTTDDLE